MRFTRNPVVVWSGEKQDDPKNDRRHGRVRCESVKCSLGRVLDLSVSGLRVMSNKPIKDPEDSRTVVLDIFDEPVEISVSVIWQYKVGFRKHLIGFEFDGIVDDTRRKLTDLARSVATNEIIRPESQRDAA